MRRHSIAVACAVFLGALTLTAPAANAAAVPMASDQPDVVAPEEVAAQVGPGERVAVAAAVSAPDGSLHIQTAAAVGPEQANAVVGRLAAEPGVSSVDIAKPTRAAVLSTAATGPDPLLSQQTALSAMGAPQVWSSATGAGQKVAVLDTGVATAHPDLAARIVPGAACGLSGGSGVCVDRASTPASDAALHGTHVAGIVAATRNNAIGVAGLAPDASIMPVRVMAPDDTGYSTDLAAGIVWAADHGATVITSSITMDAPDTVVSNAVAYALGKGVPVVVAAGNNGNKFAAANSYSYVATIPGVIAVGATDSAGAVAAYSTRAPYVAAVAPGTNVISTSCSTDYAKLSVVNPFDCSVFGYATLSGTSMAAPMVAAEVAMVRQKFPGLTPAQVRDHIRRTATDVGLPGKDNATGNGFVSPLRAVAAPYSATALLDESTTPHGRRVAGGDFVSVHVGNANQTVMGNLTVTDPVGPGYTSAYPCASGRGTASVNNFVAGQTVPNGATVKADDFGDICIYTTTDAYLLWDQSLATDTLSADTTAPRRLIDTREAGTPAGWVKGTMVDPSHVVVLPLGANAKGMTVIGNLTVVSPTWYGFTTIYPCDQGVPRDTAGNVNASVSNYGPGDVVPNFAVAKADNSGNLCFYSSAPAHLVWDQVTATGSIAGDTTTAVRLADTRASGASAGTGGTGTSGQSCIGSVCLGWTSDAGSTAASSGDSLKVQLGSANANRTVMGNLTVTNPVGDGFTAVFPCAAGAPRDAYGNVSVSINNYRGGQTIANFAVGKTDANGDICLYTKQPADLIWDQVVDTPVLANDTVTAQRLLETRW